MSVTESHSDWQPELLPAPVVLRVGDVAASVSPLGATVLDFSVGDTSILANPFQMVNLDKGAGAVRETGKRRGGIQLLFPNSGPDIGELSDLPPEVLPQHGFLRNEVFEAHFSQTEKELVGQSFQYTSDGTRTEYPFEYTANIAVYLTDDGTLRYTLFVVNKDSVDIPVMPSFHPYLLVPNGSLDEVVLRDTTNGMPQVIRVDDWHSAHAHGRNGDAFTSCEIEIPGTGTVQMRLEGGVRNIVTWAERYTVADFVVPPGRQVHACVEPFTSPAGTIRDPRKRVLVPSYGGCYRMTMSLTLLQN